ncbi:alpha/beta fold hydrolase [Fictibacillus iocasae]|uniref:Alpha/beta fold hydrolase n=1 Tax=Fictibacillus iocasae TaxID=2715437 RepID=A0ABW2NMT7_9BACL
MRDEDLQKSIQHVAVPTYIMHGKKDAICPFALAVPQHLSIKNSKLIAFEKSGHGFFYDELYRFNHELLNFLKAD